MEIVWAIANFLTILFIIVLALGSAVTIIMLFINYMEPKGSQLHYKTVVIDFEKFKTNRYEYKNNSNYDGLM